MKFLFWVAIGLWLVPQIDKYLYSYLDRKRYN